MNVDKWFRFYKLDADGRRCMAQQTYEPLISPDGKIFCKNYNINNKYQKAETANRPLYTEHTVNWFWENEVNNILKFQGSKYAPEIIDIDYSSKKIFLKWYKETCNEIIYSGRNLNEVCLDWQDQIKNIMVDLYNKGVYKLTMYPHCHYIDDDANMRSIDWYGCVPVTNPYIPGAVMDSIIHPTARFRLDETGGINTDGNYNLEIMFRNSMQHHVMWGKHSMEFVYKEIFKHEQT
jgi:hypothetical protein